MLGYIKTFCLLFGIDADTHGELEDVEDDEGEDEGEAADGCDSCQLGNEATTSEEGDSECSPNSADSVNGDGTDGIVDLDLVEEEDGNDHEGATDHSNEDGHRGSDHVRTSGDAHESSKESVESHGEIGLLEKNPTQDD